MRVIIAILDEHVSTVECNQAYTMYNDIMQIFFENHENQFLRYSSYIMKPLRCVFVVKCSARIDGKKEFNKQSI